MLADIEELSLQYITGHTCKERGRLGAIVDIQDVFNSTCFFEDDLCPGFCSNYIYAAMNAGHWDLVEYLCYKYKFGDLIAMSVCIVHGRLDQIKLMLKYVELTEEDVLEFINMSEDADQDELVEFFERYHYYNYR